MGAFRAARFFVVFDGQSLNLLPGAATGYPAQVMSRFPGVPWRNVAIGSTSWTTLATTVARRLNPYAHCGLTSVLCMNGGQTDLFTGDTGQILYDDVEAYADAARAAGFDKVLGITVPPATGYTGWPADTLQNGARLDHNDLLLADDALDAVVDVIVPGLDDPESANYDALHLHWTVAGSILAADEVEPALAALLV